MEKVNSQVWAQLFIINLNNKRHGNFKFKLANSDENFQNNTHPDTVGDSLSWDMHFLQGIT